MQSVLFLLKAELGGGAKQWGVGVGEGRQQCGERLVLFSTSDFPWTPKISTHTEI